MSLWPWEAYSLLCQHDDPHAGFLSKKETCDKQKGSPDFAISQKKKTVKAVKEFVVTY